MPEKLALSADQFAGSGSHETCIPHPRPCDGLGRPWRYRAGTRHLPRGGTGRCPRQCGRGPHWRDRRRGGRRRRGRCERCPRDSASLQARPRLRRLSRAPASSLLPAPTALSLSLTPPGHPWPNGGSGGGSGSLRHPSLGSRNPERRPRTALRSSKRLMTIRSDLETDQRPAGRQSGDWDEADQGGPSDVTR